MKIVKIPRKKEIRNEIPAALTDNTTISAGAKILWVKLYNSNRGKGKGETYQEWKPTTQALATVLGVKKLTVKRWMKELKDTGWIYTTGIRNDTILFVNYTPIVVSKKIPAVVSKMIPITTKHALAATASESACTTITTNFTEIDEDFDSFFDND